MLKAMLFDYGDTLVNYGPDLSYRALFLTGSGLVWERLRDQASGPGWDLPTREAFVKRLSRVFRAALIVSFVRQRDFDATTVLARTLAKLAIPADEALLRELMRVLYSPAGALAKPEPQLRETLAKLTGLGLRLGVLSNTILPGWLLDEHLRDCGAIDLLPMRLYTSHTGVRKPQPRVMHLALERLGGAVPASATMFVGNTLSTDILGANRVGMVSVLKGPQGRTLRRSRPAHHITALAELPALAARLM